MESDAPRRTRPYRCWCLTGVIGFAVLIGGCSQGDRDAGKSETSKFEPADNMPADRADAQAAGGSLQQPPSVPGDQLDTIVVPDGTPAELLAFAQKLEERAMAVQIQVQRGSVPPSALGQVFEAMLETAEKLFASNPDAETRKRAINYKARALSMLTQISPDRPWGQQVRAWGKMLSADADPEVAIEGKCILLGILIGEVFQGRNKDIDAMMTQIKALLAEEARNASVLDVTQQAVMALRNVGQDQPAREAFGLIAEAFKDHPDPELAAESANMYEQIALLDLDIDSKLEGLIRSAEGSREAFQEAITQALTRPNPGRITLEKAIRCVAILEQTGHYDLAVTVCQLIQQTYQDHPDPPTREAASVTTELALKRLQLIGQPLTVEGSNLDSSPFDFSPYQGKVVLVAFWMSNSPPCQQELLHVKTLYDQYHERGFEVIGVCLDPDPAITGRFLEEAKLPWSTITSVTLPETCGVEVVPFVLLLDRQGIVLDVYLRGTTLDQKLEQLFGADEATDPGTTDPGTTDEAPAEGAQSSTIRPPRRSDVGGTFASAGSTMPVDEVPTMSPVSQSNRQPFEDEPAQQQETDTETDEPLTDSLDQVNPYLAAEGLSPAELVDYLFDMVDKPKSIRGRPGFAAALVDAAERILSADTEERFQRIAADIKFATLHEAACLGNTEADQQLQAFVADRASDTRPAIARQVEFFRLEHEVMTSDDLPREQIPALLARAKAYLDGQGKLGNRHLRLASSIVHVVNRLEDEAEREKYFAEFGSLFSQSEDRQLARYGQRIRGDGKGQPSDLLGKPLELAGVTTLGAPFDWSSYRGRVVLVDFWATWCGPCLAEMPKLRALREQLADKEFDVVGVSLDEDLETLGTYLEENEVPWTILAGDETRELAQKYHIRGIPTMVLVDKHGHVVSVGHKVESLRDELTKLLASHP